jgi:hypothetical protein
MRICTSWTERPRWLLSAIAARLVDLASDEAVTRFARLEVVMRQWRRIESRLAETGPFICFATGTSFSQSAASPVGRAPPCALVGRLGGPGSPGEPPGMVARLTSEVARAGCAASRSRVAAQARMTRHRERVSRAC